MWDKMGQKWRMVSVGRAHRVSIGGMIYHALNRANRGITLFEDVGDYAAFEGIIAEAHALVPVRILNYCVMPTHWHFVLWPERDHDLSAFMQWLTLTHTQRSHAHRADTGSGHIYQGRFKSFIIETDEHLLTTSRYVERNPLRANLVSRAEDWRWSSLWHRLHPRAQTGPPLSDGPLPWPENWVDWVNAPQTDGELEAIRRCIRCGVPFGSADWADALARRYGVLVAPRPLGRPRKHRP